VFQPGSPASPRGSRPPCRPARTDRASPSADLEQAGGALSAADTHGHAPPPGPAALALDARVSREPCAAHAVRMSDRDRSAVDVQAFIRNSQLVAAIDHLDGKCLVQFPQVDVADLESRALQEPRHRKYRTNAHFIRLAAGDRESPEYSHRLDVAFLSELCIHDNAGAAAIGKLAGISGGDDAARKRGANLRHALERRVRPNPLIGRDRELTHAGHAGI